MSLNKQVSRIGTMVPVILFVQMALAQQFQHIQAHRRADLLGSKFGWSLAATDEHMVTGLPHAAGQSGRVVVIESDELAWAPGNSSIFSEGQGSPPVSQRFGAVVAVSGDQVAVGSCSAYGSDQYCNASVQWVSIYSRSGSDWQFSQVIPAPPGATGNFGKAIAMDGDLLVIGGARNVNGQVVRDVVYLYRRSGSFWPPIPVDSLHGTGLTDASNGSFGHSLSMRGELLLVGASGDDELGVDCGAAYLFGKDQGGTDAWGLVRKLLPSDGSAGDRFGAAVALHDGRCVIGAPAYKVNTTSVGAAYLYEEDAGSEGNWGEIADWRPSQAHLNMQFGASVALSADRVAVGAPLDDLSPNGTDGSVEIFAFDGTSWSFVQRIVPWYDGHVSEVSRSGTSLAFVQDKLLIGAPFAIVDDSTPTPTGAVLVYGDPALYVPDRPIMEMTCHPNPFLDGFWVSATQLPNSARVAITDPLGRTVHTMDQMVSNDAMYISPGKVAPGTYCVTLLDPRSGGIIARTSVVAE